MSTTGPPPAGWYLDPRMPGTTRYWDGADWTDHVAPAGPQKPDNTGTLTGVGIALAFLFPLGGIICGAVLLGRDPKVGALVMVLSVALAGVWYVGLAGL